MNESLGEKMTNRSVKKSGLAVVAIVFVLSAVACAPRPRPTPPPPVVEEMPEEEPFLVHTVKYSGESLALIAQWYTGKNKNWSVIRDANPGLKPERIRLGQRIRIPRALLVKEDPMPQSYVRRGAAPSGVSVESKAQQEKDGGEALPAEKAPGGGASQPEESKVAPAPSAVEGASAPQKVEPPTAVKQPQGSDDAERERLLDELLQ